MLKMGRNLCGTKSVKIPRGTKSVWDEICHSQIKYSFKPGLKMILGVISCFCPLKTLSQREKIFRVKDRFWPSISRAHGSISPRFVDTNVG